MKRLFVFAVALLCEFQPVDQESIILEYVWIRFGDSCQYWVDLVVAIFALALNAVGASCAFAFHILIFWEIGRRTSLDHMVLIIPDQIKGFLRHLLLSLRRRHKRNLQLKWLVLLLRLLIPHLNQIVINRIADETLVSSLFPLYRRQTLYHWVLIHRIDTVKLQHRRRVVASMFLYLTMLRHFGTTAVISLAASELLLIIINSL